MSPHLLVLGVWLFGVAYFTYSRRRINKVDTWSSIPRYALSSTTWPIILLIALIIFLLPKRKE